MRLKKEGNDTSKMWIIGGVVSAIALAGGAAYFAGAPRDPAPENTGATTTNSVETHSADDGHGHAASPTPDATAQASNAAASNAASANAASANAAAPLEGAGAAKPVATAKKGAVVVSGAKPTATKADAAGKTTMIQGMKVEDLRVGTGKEAKSGDHLSMDYRGTLQNGKIFDESYKRGQPFDFNLGAGMVIKGWDLGVVGMKEGGKRRLTIPADLAYGANSPSPDIPANSTLIFEIELRKIS